ncbi:MAG: phosphate ABC transporter substrate-binding protein PstS [Brevinematia bacterium]
MNILSKIFILISFLAMASCSGTISIMGAGATFPEPLYSKMFSEYRKNNSVEINYQPIGSGGGIRQLINKTVNFGATDVPMTEDELKDAKAKIVHIPVCIGAVAVVYNLSNVDKLKLSSDVLADIFLGKITNWKDKRLTDLNPDITLPDLPIVVVKRSDGSGTTYTFSEYLCAVSTEWEKTVGKGKSLNWPTGIGAKGNTGVAAYVKQTPGAIGYVEKSYASENNLKIAYLKNKANNFVLPEIENIKEAARTTEKDILNTGIINSKNKNAYPISTFSWIIVYKDLSLSTKNIKQAQAIVELLWWMTHNGQKFNEIYDFAPLPENIMPLVEERILSLVYKDKSLKQ